MASPASTVSPLRPLGRSALLELLRKADEASPKDLESAGFKSVDELATAVSDFLKIPRLALDQVDIPSDMADILSKARAQKLRVVPVFASPSEVTIATCEPARLDVFDLLTRELKRQVVTVVATPSEINKAIDRLYDRELRVYEPDKQASTENLVEATQFVDKIIVQAVDLRASDIHVEATEHWTVVRFRVDGVLRQAETWPIQNHSAVVSRIKVMAGLDISEKQAPQDGRIRVSRPHKGDIDLRVSVLPTYYGEKVVCRILDNSRASLPLEKLGFDVEHLATFRRMVAHPYGLLLVTGPTGSGKSTTLYGALNAIRSPDINIVSVEDPVEYQLPGINQVQVNPKRGMTFAGALRSILRQDPNVILIGEIRDQETGIIAAEAALTGHLVLASLHTNDAPSAITRLVEMGIEPYLIAPALVGVVAQRLMRKVCETCRQTYSPTPEELSLLGLPALASEVQFRKGTGCEGCRGTGYLGRIAVRELMEAGPGVKAAIGKGEDVDSLRAHAVKAGFRSMRHAALKNLFAGVTSAEEVLRLTSGA